MKSLKFKSHLAQMILAGTKTSTWRLFDDKDLQVGDELELIDADTKEVFVHAVITNVHEKKAREIVDADYDSHEKYTSLQHLLETFREYYGDEVNEETTIKIVHFVLPHL